MMTEVDPKRRASFHQAVPEAILVDLSGILEHHACIGRGATFVAAQDQWQWRLTAIRSESPLFDIRTSGDVSNTSATEY